MVEPNVEVTCPSCGTAFKKAPQRKTRCRSCGATIHVKYSPSDRTRRLVTAAEAAFIDQEWTRHHEAQIVINAAHSMGVEDSLVEAILSKRASVQLALRDLGTLVIHSDATPNSKMIAANMMATSVAADAAECAVFQQLAMRCSLLNAERTAIHFGTSTFVLKTTGRCCPSCLNMIGREFTAKEATRQCVPPTSCSRVQEGTLCVLEWTPAIS